MIDRAQIRADYMNGFSIRMLAAKYDVPRSTIGHWVKKYGWVQEVKAKREAIMTGAQDETANETSNETPLDRQTANREPLPIDADYKQMREYAYKVLAKADQLLEIDDALAPRDLKSLSGMLLDVRTLLNILSPREAAEQEMRLRALTKQAEDKTEADQTVRVVFVDTEGAEQ